MQPRVEHAPDALHAAPALDDGRAEHAQTAVQQVQPCARARASPAGRLWRMHARVSAADLRVVGLVPVDGDVPRATTQLLAQRREPGSRVVPSSRVLPSLLTHRSAPPCRRRAGRAAARPVGRVHRHDRGVESQPIEPPNRALSGAGRPGRSRRQPAVLDGARPEQRRADIASGEARARTEVVLTRLVAVMLLLKHAGWRHGQHRHSSATSLAGAVGEVATPCTDGRPSENTPPWLGLHQSSLPNAAKGYPPREPREVFML